MEETEEQKETCPLAILVHITEPKRGVMQVIWPPIFRGIEEPDEYYPSQALARLKKKFIEVHPDPFDELKQLEKKWGLPSKAVDFLEAPFRGRLESLIPKSEEANQAKYAEERFNDFVLNPSPNFQYSPQGRSHELEYWLKAREKALQLDQKLTESYRSWLAKSCGSKVSSYVGGWGNLSDRISEEELPCLRRGEVIPFIPMANYDINRDFDMQAHNKKALLTLCEELLSCSKGDSVLVAYGRLIAQKETTEEISGIIKQLKLYEGEYISAAIDRESFAKLVRE